MSSSSKDLFEKLLSLARLLTQKLENTNLSPSTSSPSTATAALNQEIQQQLQTIRQDPLFPDLLENEEFEYLFTELETLVTSWEAEGGATKAERAKLALIVKDSGDIVKELEDNVKDLGDNV